MNELQIFQKFFDKSDEKADNYIREKHLQNGDWKEGGRYGK